MFLTLTFSVDDKCKGQKFRINSDRILCYQKDPCNPQGTLISTDCGVEYAVEEDVLVIDEALAGK